MVILNRRAMQVGADGFSKILTGNPFIVSVFRQFVPIV